MTLIPVEELKKRVASIAIKGGIPAEDANMLAETLVVTDMRGVHSHGVVRLARYLDCIQAGLGRYTVHQE